MSKIHRILLLLASLALFVYVVCLVSPPTSWDSSTTLQILIFFLPLLAFLTLLANLFLDYLPRSLILGLGLTFLLVLQSVRLLNPISLVTTIITSTALIIFFKKEGSSSLTIQERAPKLPRRRRRR